MNHPPATAATMESNNATEDGLYLDEDTIRLNRIEAAIENMERTNILCDPIHYHSFQYVMGPMMQRCLVCQTSLFNPLQMIREKMLHYSSSCTSNSVVRCTACHAVAHRRCVMEHGMGVEKCKVNMDALLIQCVKVSTTDREMDEGESCDVRHDRMVDDKGGDGFEKEGTKERLDEQLFVWKADGPPEHSRFSPNSNPKGKLSGGSSPLPLVLSSNSSESDGEADDEPSRKDEQEDCLVESSKEGFQNMSLRSSSSSVDPIPNTSLTLRNGEKQKQEQCRYSKSSKESLVLKHLQKLSHDQSDRPEVTDGLSMNTTIMSVLNSSREIFDAAKNVSFSYKNIGVATVAGAAAGGAVGLAAAGPAGVVAGARAGSGVCKLMVAVDTLQFCVLVGGTIAGVTEATKQIDEDKVSVVTIETGKNSSKQVALLRPYIEIDTEWTTVVRRAKTRAMWSGIVNGSFLDKTGEDTDILSSKESELDSSDKIFLLVSRSLNNKRSMAGYVYRYLINEFLDRIEQNRKEDKSMSVLTCSRERRKDCHNLIYHMSQVLIEVRPGLGSSMRIAELTASSVERHVFGEIYDYVFEEIANEVSKKDANFCEQGISFSLNEADNDRKISKKAVKALSQVPLCVAPINKMEYCVEFLESLCDIAQETGDNELELESNEMSSREIGTDSLLQLACNHLLHCSQHVKKINAELAFLSGTLCFS